MEREITSSIQEYRSVIQPLWRTLSGYALEEYDWDLCDAFADLCDRIFQLTVLRPNGISGVKKARQYDQFPAEIPAFVCSPAPGAETLLLIPRGREGGWTSRVENFPPERWRLLFVDLYDFGLWLPDRTFAYILARAVPVESAGTSPRYYALLPADTTRVLFRPPRRAGGKGRAVSGNVRRKQSP